MRLICPNCDAQYEVPLDVIPDAGRDVQCSNCGHTWFQPHPHQAQAPVEASFPEEEFDEDSLFAADQDDFAEPELPEEPEISEEIVAVPAAAAATAPRKRGLDPEVADVLRAEAEREAKARAAERERLESQPDLGLSDPPPRPRRPAPPVVEPEDAPDIDEDIAEDLADHKKDSKHRRDLLPDIEEINSTLRSATEQREIERDLENEELERGQTRSGFASGLRAALVVAVVVLALYVFAPQIEGFVPQAKPFLDPLVASIDGLRIWLESQFQSLIGSVGSEG